MSSASAEAKSGLEKPHLPSYVALRRTNARHHDAASGMLCGGRTLIPREWLTPRGAIYTVGAFLCPSPRLGSADRIPKDDGPSV